MREKTQKKAIMDMMKRPIPRKWVGVVTLQMVREGKMLYGTKRFTSAVEAVDMVRPLFEHCLLYTSDAADEPLSVLDHVIVGEGQFYSFKERGELAVSPESEFAS